MGGGTDPGDLGTTQYENPNEGNNGFWASTFGTAYANEKDPSWEDVIAMVVIPGNPAAIEQAADEWRELLRRVHEVERVLTEVNKDLEHWKGAGGEEYRRHISDMIKKIKGIYSELDNLPHYLDQAAGNLRTAIDKIPIPDDMAYEVMAAKNGYIANGKVSGPWFAGGIYDTLLPVYGNKWYDEAREFFTWDWASHKLRDWISTQDDKAKDAYQALAGQHSNTMSHMPGANTTGFDDPRDPEPFDPTDPKLPGGPGGVPDLGKGMGDPKIGGPGITDPSKNPDLGNPDFTNPSTTDPNLGDPPGTGLAGAGGGGIGGLGNPGSGGLGPGVGGLGGGGGGLGGGGLGAGGLKAGGAGGLGGMMPGMGIGGGAGRGVTGAGAGRGGVKGGGAGGKGLGGARGGLGMMPHGGAGHGNGDGEDHNTWLQEDEDVWGSDSEAPPSVLG
ncbi:WXG100 family type VII secretion target [Dactylosporangium sucinum]|uniref:WXG100 family type VII secretion target n=1 Tax=Dactylosporangium sucinum TaxID=1424081 RepID=A0A917WIF1_9ACTN|nr:hypothetical protein [Dactylosporangium sucinum]GGM05677.1 hypothetical protein GCM10007977_003500 [Dactylosporangium sucinum]